MNSFSQLGIKAPAQSFTGDKIKLSRVLNEEITVQKFKIEPSKFQEKGNGKRLTLQLLHKGQQHILFSGSVTLMEMIEQVPEDKYPFTTTIRLIDERPQFT